MRFEDLNVDMISFTGLIDGLDLTAKQLVALGLGNLSVSRDIEVYGELDYDGKNQPSVYSCYVRNGDKEIIIPVSQGMFLKIITKWYDKGYQYSAPF